MTHHRVSCLDYLKSVLDKNLSQVGLPAACRSRTPIQLALIAFSFHDGLIIGVVSIEVIEGNVFTHEIDQLCFAQNRPGTEKQRYLHPVCEGGRCCCCGEAAHVRS
jgi:hypothetical protein